MAYTKTEIAPVNTTTVGKAVDHNRGRSAVGQVALISYNKQSTR